MAVLNPAAYRRMAVDWALKMLQKNEDATTWEFYSALGFRVFAKRLKKGIQVKVIEEG